MKKVFLLVGALVLSGCSTVSVVRDYNKDLTDYTGAKKVGVAFDIGYQQVRVYPETKQCIDLYNKVNGFVPNGLTENSSLFDRKRIGMPEAEGMSSRRSEYWVNANDNIAIRTLYTGETGATNYFAPKATVAESLVVFKPEPGAFYYVTVDFSNRDVHTGKYLRVYQIVDDAAGNKKLKHVEKLNIYNCSGQRPWYMKNGAMI